MYVNILELSNKREQEEELQRKQTTHSSRESSLHDPCQKLVGELQKSNNRIVKIKLQDHASTSRSQLCIPSLNVADSLKLADSATSDNKKSKVSSEVVDKVIEKRAIILSKKPSSVNPTRILLKRDSHCYDNSPTSKLTKVSKLSIATKEQIQNYLTPKPHGLPEPKPQALDHFSRLHLFKIPPQENSSSSVASIKVKSLNQLISTCAQDSLKTCSGVSIQSKSELQPTRVGKLCARINYCNELDSAGIGYIKFPKFQVNGNKITIRELVEKQSDISCIICNQNFRSTHTLHEHFFKNHYISYSCTTCDSHDMNFSLVWEHLKNHHGMQKIKYEFVNDIGVLIAFAKSIHYTFNCLLCKTTICCTDITTFTNHVSDHNYCKICGSCLHSQKARMAHMHHHAKNLTIFKCPVCCCCFKRKSNFDAHIKKECKERFVFDRTFVCQLDPYRIVIDDKYKNNGCLECPYCVFHVSKRAPHLLLAHIKSHKTYICSICNLLYIPIGTLVTNDNDVICDICLTKENFMANRFVICKALGNQSNEWIDSPSSLLVKMETNLKSKARGCGSVDLSFNLVHMVRSIECAIKHEQNRDLNSKGHIVMLSCFQNCGKFFDCGKTLFEHVYSSHGISFTCPTLSSTPIMSISDFNKAVAEVFAIEFSLPSMLSYMGNIIDCETYLYTCLYCLSKFKFKNLCRHVATKHFNCKACLQLFSSADHLQNHIVNHKACKIIFYKCTVCCGELKSLALFKTHVATSHSFDLSKDREYVKIVKLYPQAVPGYVCPYCTYRAETLMSFRLHISSHFLTTCEECHETFLSDYRIMHVCSCNDFLPNTITSTNVSQEKEHNTALPLNSTECHKMPQSSDFVELPCNTNAENTATFNIKIEDPLKSEDECESGNAMSFNFETVMIKEEPIEDS